MLVRLFGSNFRSFKGKFELSMVAADLKRKEDCDRGVVAVPIAGLAEPLQLLRTVAIYGPNASGKSTVLMAGHALEWLVSSSSEQSRPGAEIPRYEPFLLDEETRTAPIELGCDVVCSGSLLRYEIVFTAKAIESELLTVFNDHGEVKLIDRQRTGEVGGELIVHSEANRLYVKEMQPNVAVLSKLAQHGPHKGKDSVQPHYAAIRNALQWKDYSHAATVPNPQTPENARFADDVEYREWVMRHLIRPADFGIRDAKARRVEIPDHVMRDGAIVVDEAKPPAKAVFVFFVHEGSSPQAVSFPYESSGTQKLYNLSGDWWTLAHEPITLLADEMGASIHPRLLDRLVRAVNDAPADHARSQLIFTTHDTGLLESQDGQPPALRRDQVYFTKKDASGVSELYSLAEFKDDARPVHNIRKRYLSGLYGALPIVEKLSL